MRLLICGSRFERRASAFPRKRSGLGASLDLVSHGDAMIALAAPPPLDRARFSEAALFADASAHTRGLTDFGPDVDFFRESLAVLVESTLAESHLRDLEAFRRFLLHHLTNRLLIQRALSHAPEISALPLPPITFISGLPRAGTSTFSRLLAEDPAARTLRLWELHSPAPTDLEHPWALTEDRLAAAEDLVLSRARRGALGIRPMSLFLPDECFYLFRNSFSTDHLHRAVARRPTYFHWVGSRDRTGVYSYYKLQLQLLLWQRPCPPTGHLVLKNPFVHLECMPALFANFPDASVVNLTRDVVDVMKSLCHKNLGDQKAHTDLVTPHQVGADMAENLEHYYERRATSLDHLSDDQRARLVSIDHSAWAADPVAIMRRLYQRLGRSFDEPLADAMNVALSKHARYGESARYDLADYGLDEHDLRERFEPYEAAFRDQVDTIEAAEPKS